MPNKTYSKEELEKLNEQRQRKMMTHLETLNDGVIAIIMTILVLEIPAPHGISDYWNFLNSIVVFIISFFIVADFWYELNKIYASIEYATKGIIISDLLYLASLSVMPILTKWIIENPSSLAVINYGVMYMIIELVGLIIRHFVFQLMTREHEDIQAKESRLVRIRSIILFVINVFYILLSFNFPKIMIYAYLSLPAIHFFFPAETRIHLRKRYLKK